MDVAATQLLTVDETAQALRQSRSTIRRKIAEGMLAAVRLGDHGLLRVPADELDKHLRPASGPRRTSVAATTADDAVTARTRAGLGEAA